MSRKKIAADGQSAAGQNGYSNGFVNGHIDKPQDTTAPGKSQPTTPVAFPTLDTNSIITPAQVAAEDRQAAAQAALLNEGVHDEGNAQCVLHLYPNMFAQNSAYGWLMNTGSHWVAEGAEAALGRAVTETLKMRVRAALDADATLYSEILKKCTPTAARKNGAKDQLTDILYTPLVDFDDSPDVLNVANGVIDLRAGTIRAHEPGDRFLYCVPTDYDPEADQSGWVDWLRETVGPEMADWLQMAVGYTITGHTQEETLFYLYGPPRAGKGLFTETIGAMLGQPLAKEIEFGTFTSARNGDSQNFDLAPLKPARAVLASESNSYERFNEAKIKKLTGGNDIYCAFKHHTHFTYRPQFKIWLSSNQPVNADPDDDAVWGRLRVVEFARSFLGRENKGLKRKFRGQRFLRGVLAWAVAGAARWYALGDQGLPELQASAQAKAAQRAEVDHVGAWLDECCITEFSAQAAAEITQGQAAAAIEAAAQPGTVADREKRQAEAERAAQAAETAQRAAQAAAEALTAGSMLYLSYEKWCTDNGIKPKGHKGLTQALKAKGCRATDGVVKVAGQVFRGFYGIAINAQNVDDPQLKR